MVDGSFRWPDFFIVGAPKCGTTAFAAYLAERTDIKMSVPKEPHYFSTDLNLDEKSRAAQSLDLYKKCFGEMDARYKLGEASVFYLHSQVAIPGIMAKNPAAKIFVFLRNPVDMAISLHQQFAQNLWEDQPFELAWESCLAGGMQREVPRECPSQELLNYHQLCLLGEQSQRLLDCAPRQNVEFLLLDEIRADPRAVYLRMLAALNLVDDCRTHFPVVNPAQATRWPLMRKLLRATAKIKATVGVQKEYGTTTFLRDLNKRAVNPHSVVTDEFKAQMKMHFKEDVVLLERLTGLPVVNMWGFQ